MPIYTMTAETAKVLRAELARLKAAKPSTYNSFNEVRAARVAAIEARLAGAVIEPEGPSKEDAERTERLLASCQGGDHISRR